MNPTVLIPTISLRLFVLLLFPALVWAQTSSTPEADTPAPASQLESAQNTGAPISESGSQQKSEDNALSPAPGQSQDQNDEQSSRGQQTKRMVYVVPNFAAVSAGKQLPPLSVKGKFHLATQDSFDYSSFVWTGVLAAQSFALDSYPELGSGAAGYGQYYWRAFVDGVSGTYFTEAIVPALTHQDPRYYTLGEGSFLKRLGYALSRVAVTKTDSGSTAFNISEVGGNAAEAGLANLYYPAQERSVGKTAENWAVQIESAALNNIAKEFWPDVRRYVLRRK